MLEKTCKKKLAVETGNEAMNTGFELFPLSHAVGGGGMRLPIPVYLSLAPIQVDLRDALAMNVVLAESYHKLQCEFIAAKTLALRVLGRKLDLETSLKDHKQVSQMLHGVIFKPLCVSPIH